MANIIYSLVATQIIIENTILHSATGHPGPTAIMH